MKRLSLIFLVLSAAASAQTPVETPAPSSDQSPIPIYQTNSHAVVVDIVVTRQKGDPVLGLHQQDFRVFEDGKPQNVDFFEEHTAIPAPPVTLPKLPPNVYSNVPAAPLTDSVNVLLLDSLNTPGADQVFVHQQVLKYVQSMKPGTRIAVFTLGDQLNFIQGFTSDPTQLLAALNGHAFAQFNPLNTSLSRSGGGNSAGHSVVATHDNFNHLRRDEMTLEAFRIMARYLTAIPGRKNLIWFSTNFPIYLFPEKQAVSHFPEMDQEIRDTSDLLTLARVAVYPIEAEGMMNDHWMEADQSGNSRGAESGEGAGSNEGGSGFGRGSSAGPALMSEAMSESTRRARIISNMEQVAADTGGQAIFNSNDLIGAMARSMQNGAHYYTLVYTPLNTSMNGQFRQIDVKLDPASTVGQKLTLSYRRGYYADDLDRTNPASPSAKKSKLSSQDNKLSNQPMPLPGPQADPDPLHPLLVHGLPSATQLLYAVRVEPAPTQPASNAKRAGANDKLSGPTVRYNADFLIDWKTIHLDPTPDGKHTGRIQIGLLARDKDGKAVNWTGGTMILNLDPATYADVQKSGIRAHAELDLPRTNIYLATGVYDLAAHKAGTLEIPLAPAPTHIASASK